MTSAENVYKDDEVKKWCINMYIGILGRYTVQVCHNNRY